MISKLTLHTREDGTKYLLDVGEYELQEGKINALINLFNSVAETLSKYTDTRDRAKNPNYLLGVLKGRIEYIEDSRAEEIFESLKNFPLGEKAKMSLVQQSLDEIPIELNKAMESYALELGFIRRDIKKMISLDNDLVITAGEDMCSVSLREGLLDELRISMIREVSQRELDDNETFRNAIQLLWSLADKGYYLADGIAMSADGTPTFTPSIVDRLMRKEVINNPKGRDILLCDERLLNSLYMHNSKS